MNYYEYLWNRPGRTPEQGLVQLPRRVEFDGYLVPVETLTIEQLDAIGWNRAIPLEREDFTTYEISWVKDGDLIYQEVILSAVVDEGALTAYEATEVRAERDRRLTASDWTQLADAPLDDTAMVLWQSYRQALRDVPQQAGFPSAVEWPDIPANE